MSQLINHNDHPLHKQDQLVAAHALTPEDLRQAEDILFQLDQIPVRELTASRLQPFLDQAPEAVRSTPKFQWLDGLSCGLAECGRI